MHDAPIFFWLIGIKKENIIKLLEKAFSLIVEFQNKISILHISAVVGKTEYSSFLKLFSPVEKSHLGKSKEFPVNGLSDFFQLGLIDRRQNLEEQATYLADKVANDQDVFPEKETLLTIDYELYSQKDGY
jgi:hypothetical protein